MSGAGENAPPGLPKELFRRADESSDALFYGPPRLVTHIDDATIAALTDVYRDRIPKGGRVLDLMSSGVSHLPPDVDFERVAGLGMNAEELERNPRLDEWIVHDLNVDPELPYPDASFDAVLNAVSVQYLIRPVEVFASVRRVLVPDGLYLVACSHRLFATKAIAAFQALSPPDRMRLIVQYFQLAGGYTPAEYLDASPENADPLWIVFAQRAKPSAD